MRRLITVALLVYYSLVVGAQGPYAPPAGQAGSTAIAAGDERFTDWAKEVVLERGYLDISSPSLGYASIGDENSAIGKALENGVVSLGDGGRATLTFHQPIQNIPGPDFAVFENGFSDYFLELAFVEVSSNGIDFYRFPAVSLTDTSSQVTYDSIYASNLYNLAGKYRGGFGTPFDLEELSGITGLNINSITHIKIIDAVGSINPLYAGRDSKGRPINDPWPTAFPSGGFDLDAVGVIGNPTGINGKSTAANQLEVFPNPASNYLKLRSHTSLIHNIELYDFTGKPWLSFPSNSAAGEITLELNVPKGAYLLKVQTESGVETIKVFVN